jgi:hypothetical protein
MRKLLLAWMVGGMAGLTLAASSITGNVTGPGGVPLDGIQVSAYRYNGSWYEWEDYALSESSGDYTLANLPAGTYRLEFWDEAGIYASEWYDDALTRGQAEALELTDNVPISGIDAQLAAATRITGTVTDGSANPLNDITAWVYWWSGSDWEELFGMGTDSNGAYEITGIPAGTYLVRFEDHAEIYAPEYYSNAIDRADALEFEGVAGETVSGINGVLAAAGSLSGTVTGPDGSTALSGVHVQAYRFSDGEYAGWGQTDVNGHYTIGGLAAGAHGVRFYAFGSYVGEWYSNATSEAEATPVVLAEGQNVTGIDASLGTGGSLAGTVTETGTGTPLAGVEVLAHLGPDYGSARVSTTDGSGSYEITGLSSGNYKVEFRSVAGFHKSEWWSNQTEEASATVISVAGTAVGNVNAELDKAATIAGLVTASGGLPLGSINAAAYRWDGSAWSYARSAWTETNGTYRIGPLAAGTYVVAFRDYENDYLPQYHEGVVDIAAATPLELADGESIENIDATMVLAPVNGIAGTVTQEGSGLPLAYCLATAYAYDGTNWVEVAFAQADHQGYYRIKPLDPGVYRVRFFDYSGDYVPEYYHDKTTVEAADDVTVEADVLTENINASLAAVLETSLSGTVTSSGNGLPLSGIMVVLYVDLGDWTSISTTFTLPDGTYQFGGLSAGTYRVGFQDWFGAYSEEYYDNADSVGGATDIPVNEGDVITGIDAGLALFSQSPPPSIVGLRKALDEQWEILFTLDDSSTCILQVTDSLENSWSDVGAPTNCAGGTNVLCGTGYSPSSFFKVIMLP